MKRMPLDPIMGLHQYSDQKVKHKDKSNNFESRALGDFQENVVGGFSNAGLFHIHRDYEPRPNHTARLPENGRAHYDNQGDLSLTTFPFFNGNDRWCIGGHWAVDDLDGPTHKTLKNVVS